MICKNCKRQIDDDAKICPYCKSEVDIVSGGGSNASVDNSVFNADHDIHVGDKHEHIHEAPDPGKKKQATHTGIHCPICHQVVIGADHFECPKCKRSHIHNEHQNPDSYLCRECHEELLKKQGVIRVGDTFGNGRYTVKKHLGQGGMGQVFLVSDNEWDKDFAFKFLPEALSSDKSAVVSLKKEAGLMAQLTHENLARIFDLGSDGNRHYIKMEYIEGKTLAKIIEDSSEGRLSLEETVEYLKQIVKGLQYLHDKNVVHRDLKPGNIMVTLDGSVKILDFGIAQTIKDTMTRVTNMPSTGTLVYMSPEQLKGHKLSPRSDIYSLGIIIYELLNGKPPFHTGPIFEQHLNVEPEPIDSVPANVNSCILKALSKGDGERFESCDEFYRQIISENYVNTDSKQISAPEVQSDTRQEEQTVKPHSGDVSPLYLELSRAIEEKNLSHGKRLLADITESELHDKSILNQTQILKSEIKRVNELEEMLNNANSLPAKAALFDEIIEADPSDNQMSVIRDKVFSQYKFVAQTGIAFGLLIAVISVVLASFALFYGAKNEPYTIISIVFVIGLLLFGGSVRNINSLKRNH